MTYLIVGLDLETHEGWHENVSADDVNTAKRIARARATAQGIDLVIAAAVGPHSAVISDSAGDWAATPKAAWTHAAEASVLPDDDARFSMHARVTPGGSAC